MKTVLTKLKRVLSFVMAFVLVLGLVPATAMAAGETKTIHLEANSSFWNQGGAWFQAWVWGSAQADAWYTFKEDTDADGIYQVEIPADATKMKILRRGPSHAADSWDSNQKWDETGDLTIGSNNYYKITGWNAGSWSTKTPSNPTYTVVGEGGLFGGDWDPANTANDMTEVSSGKYQKVFKNVEVGTYQYKVAVNHSWDVSWGNNGSNVSLKVDEAGSTVTVTFNASTKTVSHTVVKEYAVTPGDPVGATVTGAATAEKGKSYTFNVAVHDGYELKEDGITVAIGGTPVEFAYDAEAGTVTVAADKITGDLEITVKATEIVPDVEYYLIGYINGADYGCNDDYANLGEYKFVNGKVTVNFTQDSYVFVKTGDNAKWYLFKNYCDISTGTAYNGKDYGEKMFIPGGRDITITLTEVDENTLTLGYNATYTVAGSSALCGTNWDVSNTANDMTKNDSGLYEKVFNDVAAGNYEIKVAANHGWTNAWGNGSSNLAVNVEKDGSTVTVTFDEATKTVTVKVTAPSTPDPDVHTVTTNLTNITGSNTATSIEDGADYTTTLTAATGYTLPETVTVTVGGETKTYTYDKTTGELKIPAVSGDVVITAAGVAEAPSDTTVYCINSAKWAQLSAHYWIEGGASTSWPGVAMTKTSQTVNGFDVYSITFDPSYENVIFNNNGNGSQTADLDVQPGKYYDVKSAAWYDSLEDVPAVDELASDVYLAGSFNSWSTTANEFKLTAVGAKTATVTMDLEAATDYEFKVIPSGAWYGCDATITESTEGLQFTTSGGNCKLTTGEAGTYTFTYDLDSKKLSVAFPEQGEPETITVYFRNDWLWTDVTVTYTQGGSDTTEAMTKVGTAKYGTEDRDVYSAEIPADATQIVFGGTKDDGSGSKDATPAITDFVDGDAYYIHWDNGNKASKFTYPEQGEPEEGYFLIGYINGADYTGSDYKFEDGKLTANFTGATYVAIKDGAGNQYFFETYNETTSGTLYTGKGYTEKMLIPTNVDLTFTLLENADGSLALSYAEGASTGETYTAIFHFADQKGWGGANLYLWLPVINTTVAGGWPGTAMSLGDDGFYSLTVQYEAPADTGLNVIFNGGGTQTVDLSLAADEFDENNKVEKWVKLTDQTEGKWNAAFYDTGDSIAVSPIVNGTSVTFQYENASATSVKVYGTMNAGTTDDWNVGYSMTKNSAGIWSVTVNDLEPGIHQYKFSVDGSSTWITDPLNNWTENGNSAFLVLDPNAPDTNKITINVYYERADGKYTDTVEGEAAQWNLYAWGNGVKTGRYDFTKNANGEMVTTIVIEDGRSAKTVSMKTRLSSETKDWVKEEAQVDVNLTDIVSGTIDVYIKSDGTGGNAGNLTVTQKLNTDIKKANKITDLQYDYDTGKVTLTTLKALTDPMNELKLTPDVNDQLNLIESIASNGNTYVLTLKADADLNLVNLHAYIVHFDGYEYTIGIDTVYASDKFAEEFTYDGEDLGANYTSSKTTFKLWAPTAEVVHVKLYATGSDSETGAKDLGEHLMTKGEKGVWTVTVDGDLNGKYYTYEVKVGGKTVEAVDPYARTAGVNGERGMIIDLDSTDPSDGWSEASYSSKNYTDAILYELHVRDFSIDDSSGVKDAWQGKFLGLTETGTKTPGGATTGLDYLKDLGITHLHLLPIYDYASVKEDKLDKAQFNWGYDPLNYNVPEGSYSTNPYKGEVRVQEMKQMVDVLHENDINVVMDVVYNHVYDADTFCFNQIVPGYFSRVDSNTSGCGNDTASEREMVRKYIVDSVVYWATEYHIDGFRFDLVGLIDVETINQIVTEVHKVRPDVVFYGEGWDMDGTNKEPGTQMAKQGNASKTPGFAYFSDSMRNLLGGDNGKSKGFASGADGKEETLVTNSMAKPGWTTNPTQVVQYASCHDNYTLADKIILSTGKTALDAEVAKMNNLAAASYMTAQGIPFIHAGEEMLREKLYESGKREENSYNKGDAVNHIEWSNLDKAAYAENSAYYKGLIEFRKAHPALRYSTAAEVADNVQKVTASGKIVTMLIDGNGAKDRGEKDDILVILNANNAAKTVNLPEGTWTINVKGNKAGTASLGTAEGSVSVEAISALILTKTDEGKDEKVPLAPSAEKSVYFSNNKRWDKVYAYAWTDGGEKILLGEWPGSEATKVDTNDYGEDIYEIKLPASETGIEGLIISNGQSEQTVDIEPGADGTGYYCADPKNDEGKWPVGTYPYRAPVLGAATDYFLVGYINGDDFVGGDYKFVDGKVTVEFSDDAYVYVINGTGTEEYKTDGWLGSVPGVKMHNIKTATLTADKWDKFLIPGGSEVELTMVKNDDGTITLSYTVDAQMVEDTSGVQDGVTLHCWNWSFAEIEANMAEIAAQGYTAIQTSPIQPLKEATNLSTNTVGKHWWVYYQPIDFEITTQSGNALGTKDELISMIKTAHKYDVKVIVDVVANHLANETGNNLSPAIPEYLRADKYWHDISKNTNDWNNRYEVTQYCMGGLPDLNTANEEIQGYVLDFLKECVDAGVDGFRFDAAKSIETPDDEIGIASNFWHTVITGAESYAKEKNGKDLYIYGEILDTTTGLPISAYTKYMAITDNSWGNTLRGNIASDKAAMAGGYNKAAPASALVLWAESHDTYATDDANQSSLNISDEDIVKTWALVAARADAMGLYFARPESMTQALGVASVTDWANDEVEQINKFHNAFVGEIEYISNENGISYVERGNSGVVLVKAVDSASSDISVTANLMKDGAYVDQITGTTFTVANGKITGTIGDTGIAVVYNAAEETKYTVTVESVTGGTVTSDKEEAALGETVTVTVKADEGKVLETIIVTDADDNEITLTKGENGTYTFGQPASDVTVKATFIAETHTHTVKWVDEDGEEIDSVTVNHGEGIDEADIPAVPEKDGYTGAWSVTDLAEITEDLTIEPVYTAIEYENDVKESGSGSVEINPTKPVAGDKVTVTVTPDEGIETEGIVVKDASGKEIPVTENEDGTYSFTQPVGEVTVEALFKAAYKIIKGDGSKIVHGSDNTITITVNGAYNKFRSIKIDGELVKTTNYTAKAGSTIITLKAEYLKTLEEGEHTITVIYTDGETEGTFYLNAKSDGTTTPPTGDNSQLGMWIGTITVSTLAMAAVLMLQRKKKQA